MSTSVDADIQREHAYQREHLEKTVSTLKKRLTSDNQHHHDDNVRIMQVNQHSLVLAFVVNSLFDDVQENISGFLLCFKFTLDFHDNNVK